jgi:hypothetical protein
MRAMERWRRRELSTFDYLMAGAYTRPLLKSTRAVSHTTSHPAHPKHPLTPP